MDNGWIPLAKIQTPLYQENLRFLSVFDHPLYEQIQNDNATEQLEIKKTNGLVCCRTSNLPHEYIFGQHNPKDELQTIQSSLKEKLIPQQLLIVIGSSCGYSLQGIIPYLLLHPNFRAVWMEPSVSRISLALRFVDFRPALKTGRFHIAISNHDEPSVFDILNRFQAWNLPNPTVFCTTQSQDWHQTFSDNYQDQSQQHSQQIKRVVTAFSQKETNPPKKIKSVLLIDCWQNAVQRIHLQSIDKSLQKCGIQTKIITVGGYRFDIFKKEYRRLIEWDVLQVCDEVQPDLIISYAYHATHMLKQNHFEEMKIPWLQVVSNLVFQDDGYYPNEYTALCEKKLITEYQSRGAKNIFYIPIMANYCVDEIPQTDHSIPVVFVGNSLGLNPNEAQSFLQKIKPNNTLYQYVVQSQHEVGNIENRINLFDYIEKHPIPDTQSRDEWHEVFRYLLCQTTHHRRTALLESLADLGLHLYGNWKDRLEPDSPLQSCLKGHLPFEQEQQLFNHTSLFVNIHSSGNATCPNMRFFNTAGLGGMHITDGCFHQFLEDRKETVFYHNVKEFREQVEHYLHHQSEAETIRQNAISRIKQDWTYDKWLDEVLNQTGFIINNE